jgi:ketosteroid isomerase-like protein
MSSEHDLIRGTYQAMTRGDLDWVVAVLDPDAEYHNPNDAIEPGVRRGRDEVEAALRGLLDLFDYQTLELTEIVEAPNGYLVTVDVHAQGRGSGVPINQRFWHLVKVRDDKLLRLEWFSDREKAQAAARGDQPG